MNFKNIFFTIIICCFFVGTYPVLAYVASSGNYRIQSDSVDSSGGLESSANYKEDSSVGEIATGEGASATYKLKAGYQQMQETYISVSTPTDVTMSPAIGGISGGTGNGSTAWTILTDNPAGYTLSIKASSSPALQSGSNSFLDYTLIASSTPDYNWSVISTGSEFGFTPEGNDIIQKYKDNGSSCNVGILDTVDKCWYNFLTSDETVAQSFVPNHPSGTATNVKFRAESGNSHLQIEGTYQAIITATVIAN
ncbi:MAG: hypothetical protein Q7T79_02495 [bacterium]|nr:hypothetical protein [bacterium]